MTRPLFRLARVEPAKTYVLLSTDQLGGGATCTINDGTGELLIQSDWGTWAHQWSTDPRHMGAPTLTDFLRAHDRTGYVWDKLHYGRPREEFDPEATCEFLRGEVYKLADADTQEDDLWEIDNELANVDDYSLFYERCSEKFQNMIGVDMTHMVMRVPQGSQFLYDVILPSLWEALRAAPPVVVTTESKVHACLSKLLAELYVQFRINGDDLMAFTKNWSSRLAEALKAGEVKP